MRGFTRDECKVITLVKQPDQITYDYTIKNAAGDILERHEDFLVAQKRSRFLATKLRLKRVEVYQHQTLLSYTKCY